jgi:hypothetical protein
VREHPKHPRNALRIHRGYVTSKMVANRLRVGSIDQWGRPIPGWLRSPRLSSVWLQGGSQGQFPMYGSVGGGLLGLCALESLCWTRGGVWFVGKCFSRIDEVSWTHGILCASTSPRGLMWVPPDPHDVMCISLSSGLRCMQMIYLFRSSRQARRVGANQFGIWGCLWWFHIYAIGLLALNYIIPCTFTCVLQQNIETPTLVEIVSIKPYSSVDYHFSFILCRSLRYKSGT